MNARLESLPLIHEACWQELARLPHNRLHAWRVMALATLADDAADLRSVVIREVNPEERTLLFFTDARSPKVSQIERQPAGSMLAWCNRLGWQLRLRVVLEVQTSGLSVSSRWARLKMTPAAHDYLSPLKPGTPIEHHRPERGTRDHFAVVQARVQTIDWLELHAEGHRRAIFDASGQGQWVVP